MDLTGVKNKYAFFVVCLVLNLAGLALSACFCFPINLDVIGSILASSFLSLPFTVAAAVVPHFIIAQNFLSALLSAVSSAAVAVIFYYGIKRLHHLRINSYIALGTFSAFAASLLLLIFSFIPYFNDGNIWSSSLAQLISESRINPLISKFASFLAVNLFDIQICSIVSFGIIQVLNYKAGKLEKRKAKKVFINFAVISVLLFPILIIETIFIHHIPERKFYDEKNIAASKKSVEGDVNNPVDLDNYRYTLYDRSSGMTSSDSNCICETDDGYIWIGSYSGLTKYDGTSFTFLSDSGITNVTAMMKDREGALWIGTNDQGVARYNAREDKFVFCNLKDDNSVYSIRSFCQTSTGKIYVGTSGKLCRIGEDGFLKVIDADLNYISSIVSWGNRVAGTTRQGEFFVVEDDHLVALLDPAEMGFKFTCVAFDGFSLVAGTSENFIKKIKFKDGKIELAETLSILKLFNITSLYFGKNNNLFFTTESEIGLFNEKFEMSFRFIPGFSKIRAIHEDYEGNLWVSSARYGVLKFSENNFSKINLHQEASNAVCLFNGKYYFGTDKRLEIKDAATGKFIYDDLAKYLEKNRIRYLYKDLADNLWICSYGDKGLVKYSKNGNIQLVSKGDLSQFNFRCITNVDKENLVAGTKANGILFLNSDGTTNLVDDEDGLSNLQILSLYVDAEKNVYAGTDGGGIYVLKDQKIVKHIDRSSGLTSDVIMKIVPYKDKGTFLVTSNSLCYMENDSVVPLTKFPFYNNFDVILKGEKVFVTASSGLYELSAEDLRQNKISSYKLYDRSMGLDVDFVPNSVNVAEKNRLLLCSNSGVYSFDLMKKDSSHPVYKFDVSSVTADGQKIKCEDGKYVIPAGVRKISLLPGIRNYSIPNFKIKFYVEGYNDEAEYFAQDKISPLNIYHLNYGTYRIWIKIFDDANNLLQEKNYLLKKEAFIWETTWYKLFSIYAVFLIFANIIWSVVSYILYLREELRVQDQKRIQEVIETFTGFVDAKDSYTAGHSSRVAQISKTIASYLGYSDEVCQNIFYCALLHDCGKIGIPDSILTKPGALSDEEYASMKTHTIKGWEILHGMSSIPDALNAARSHHERFDGSGYPDKLKGKDIPELARIICLADSYDAMNTNRCYRDHLEKNVIIEELRKCAGTQFDPDLVEILIKLIKSGVV